MSLDPRIESSPVLAEWLGVEEVMLVREDLLPDGGGKKRRALASLMGDLLGFKHIHLVSYAGSHTAYTLSQIFPEKTIHLYGTHYGGGDYEHAMVALLNQQSNVIQQIGSPLSMLRSINQQKRKAGPGHYFLKIGGEIGSDPITNQAVEQVVAEIGDDFHHVVAVASGDLLRNIQDHVKAASGVLTQPLGIRLIKALTLKDVKGVSRSSLEKRVELMKEIRNLTGNLWDPVFMGVVFSYLKQRHKLPSRLCIWVTCPAGVAWLD